MNPEILHPEVQQFITNNLDTDISKLIFKGSPYKKVTIQELAEQIISKKKAEKKLPTWFQAKNIYYPPKLNLEQTSSEITAEYKANLISGKSLIDITGGFGIDCLAFSKKIDKIKHCEINNNLSTIVKHNYQQFGIENIETISGDGIEYLANASEKFDWIYIDPSRRNDSKEKVFLLKDCLPNVPENLELLFTKTQNILIKNSPILDITNTINELSFVKEIHIVAVQNEVKELLFVLEKNYKNTIKIKTININKKNNQLFDFQYNKIKKSNYSKPENYLFEPNSAILKSGGFHEVSAKFNIKKLHQHSHLYTHSEPVNFPGRVFKIERVLSYSKKEIKNYLKENKANITVRNFPETVAEIRKKTKIKDGGLYYLFFTTDVNNKLIVIITTKYFT